MPTAPSGGSVMKGGEFLLEACAPESVFTPARLSDDQKLIGKTAEEFVEKEIWPRIAELESHKEGLMPELLKKAGELGLLGGEVPEEYGGGGLDKVSATLLSEKLAGYASFGVSHGGHCGIGTLPLVYFGTEEQKRKYLPRLATGEIIGCYCLSEPQAGSDALAARTRAELSPDGKYWLLSGQKMWITNGGFADLFTVFAKVDGEKFSCFLVERGAPGFSVGAEENKMGIRGSSTVPIFFENAKIPRENLLHEAGRGHIVAFNILNVGRFSLGAYCLGGAKKTLEAAARYAQERTAFGQPLAGFGLIQAKLGEMATRTFAVESMLYRSAGMIEAAMEAAGRAPDPSARTARMMKVLEQYAIECSICKVQASELLDFVVDEAVQIFGGYGFHEEYPVARAYRDSRVNRIFEGTNEINRMLIVQMLMKRAMAGALPLMPAAKRLAEEVLAGPPVAARPEGPLGAERLHIANAKKAFLLAAGAAAQRYLDKLAGQQEILAALADIASEIYAMESATLRAVQALSRQDRLAEPMAMAARLFVYDSLDRIEKQGRTVLEGSVEGDTLRAQLAVLRRFCRREPADTIHLRRTVASGVIAAGRYPFEGH